MHRVGSVLVTVATIPLALGLAGDTYVVIRKVTASPTTGIIAASAAFTLLIGLWHVYPLVAASIRHHHQSSVLTSALNQSGASVQPGPR